MQSSITSHWHHHAACLHGGQQQHQQQHRLWPSQRLCSRRSSRSPRSRSRSVSALPLEDRELRQLLGQSYLRPEYEEHSDEQVADLVEAAAGLISVIDDLRPLDPSTFNAFYEIYRSIAAVPPADRARILDELEPGALYSLWRASVGQYVLDEQRKAALFADHIIWDDFPKEPGQVFTFEGLCEQFKYERALPPNPAVRDAQQRRVDPRLKPWLKASPTAMATPQERFKQQFFVAKRTGLLHSRLLLKTGPLSSLFTPPMYSRLEIGLTLTPSASDAGADAALVYPFDEATLAQRRAAGVALTPEDLPPSTLSWPPPLPGPAWSPLSFGERDYLRVAGPGFYVGCAYRANEAGQLLDEERVFFGLVRTTY